MVVKVSREVAEAIEYALENIPGQDKKENLLKRHVINSTWEAEDFKPLNNLSIIQLAEILLNDYEIEETPEEKILMEFKAHSNNYAPDYDTGFKNGIKYVLKELNIKIKGIND